MEIFDVVIIGAGISGIGSAWHLLDKCPGKSFVILEA
jgi:monooxygenase